MHTHVQFLLLKKINCIVKISAVTLQNFKTPVQERKNSHFQQSGKLLRTGPICGLAHCQHSANDHGFCVIINSQVDEMEKLSCSF